MADKIAHVDIGNQIDNSWCKDSALAIKIEKIGFSIKIRGIHKNKIKRKFIRSSTDRKVKRNNRRVAVILHCLLLYRLLDKYQELYDVVRVCGDMGPFSNINKYYSKICKYYSNRPDIKLKPRKGKEKSKAHRIANSVYNGRTPENILIKSNEMDEIIVLIETLL